MDRLEVTALPSAEAATSSEEGLNSLVLHPSDTSRFQVTPQQQLQQQHSHLQATVPAMRMQRATTTMAMGTTCRLGACRSSSWCRRSRPRDPGEGAVLQLCNCRRLQMLLSALGFPHMPLPLTQPLATSKPCFWLVDPLPRRLEDILQMGC